jgi:uncharacterized protein YbjT (DUF2867 family)
MRVLVTSATGTIGQRLLPRLSRAGVEVLALTRDAAKAPVALRGVEWLTADLGDPVALAPIFARADRVFLVVPGVPEEAHVGLAAVTLAQRGEVERLVYLSVHQTADLPRHAPHIAAKLVTEQAVRASGLGHAILRPNAFFQNDLWYRRALLREGVYPQPLGPIGVSACDAGDIAEAAERLLLSEAALGAVYDLVGPEPLDAERAAEHWSEALGRRIVSAPWDGQAWLQAQLQRGTPPWLAYELLLMYEAWRTRGYAASGASVQRLAGLLGRPPRGHADFARETARLWCAQRPE